MPVSFPRFISRPRRIGKTPRKLVEALGASRTIIPYRDTQRLDWAQDLLTFYPSRSYLDNPAPSYNFIRSFFSSNKPKQRLSMHLEGLPIVPTRVNCVWYGGEPSREDRLVVRPTRHQGGRHFHVLPQAELADLPEPADSYISLLVNKTAEYRVLYFRGRRVATYIKQNPENIPADQPWNHDNGTRFCTLTYDTHLSRQFYQKLEESKLVQVADLLAFDVLWDGQPHITEVNFCPGITIQRTFDRIKAINTELGARA